MFLVYCDHMDIMVIIVAFVGINWVWIWEKNLCWGLIDSELKTGIKARKSAQSIQVRSHILRILKLGRKQENVELKAQSLPCTEFETSPDYVGFCLRKK